MNSLKEIVIKASGMDVDDVEKLVSHIEERYYITRRSYPLKNDRSSGYHLFATLIEREEAQ